jgi:hypothetical protein
MWGFIGAAALMAAAGAVEVVLGVDAEQETLEDVTAPLSAADEGGETEGQREPQQPAPGGADGKRSEAPRRRRPVRHPAMWSGFPEASAPVSKDDLFLEREVDRIVAALTDAGPVRRHELAALIAARRWGPGRFRRALRVALEEGRVQRVGRERYAVRADAELEPGEARPAT